MRTIVVALLLASSVTASAAPPAGFTSLFNGNDLSGWRGRPHFDPAKEAEGTDEERAKRQQEWNADMAAHWKVEDGVIVSDGHGVFLTTDRDYADFELQLEWMFPRPCGDSGIYLRGNPQVQLWDPACERDFKNGCQKGSGGLWNSPAGAEGKDPLVKADRPIGEWNSTRVRIQGDRVTVVLNDQLVVDNQPLPNYFSKGATPLPDHGPIQIQTHGAPMHVRNVFIRELPGDRAGFVPLFNGRDLSGWQGATDGYEAVNGELRSKPGVGGNLLTTDEFGDFVLRFDFKLTPGANNGLAIRVPPKGNAAFDGIELQILDDGHEKYKDLQPWQAHGSIYGVVAAERGTCLKPAGQWNSEEVTVQGSKIKVVVNGKTILDADTAAFRDGQATPDGKPHPGLARTQGHIGFAGHHDEVHFRNIRVKRL